jgi:hypothetical protein
MPGASPARISIGIARLASVGGLEQDPWEMETAQVGTNAGGLARPEDRSAVVDMRISAMPSVRDHAHATPRSTGRI